MITNGHSNRTVESGDKRGGRSSSAQQQRLSRLSVTKGAIRSRAVERVALEARTGDRRLLNSQPGFIEK